ncbi:hypothetical protein OAE59_00140 [Synechococcus sp. AH-551-B05]|nr:hypothetical protein [Synechococcus sp. AH-551-B05]MDB4677032.1 hypothetical protein [Synechococcus sp. AH-551-B05]
MASIINLKQEFQDLIADMLAGKAVNPQQILELYKFSESQFFEKNPGFITSNWNWDTNTLNGNEVQGSLLPLQDNRSIINEIIDGQRLVANLGVRKAGTRVGVHVHEAGGATFVVGGEGAITDFVEGFEDTFNPVGNYYFMPYNTPMSATNLSDEDVVLLDIFYVPLDKTAITILEPGYSSYFPPSYFDEAAFVSPSFTEQLINGNNYAIERKQFEILGDVKNLRPINIDFSTIENSDTINIDQSTAGGGTITSNALFLEQGQKLNGIYFNSAAGNDKIIGSQFNDFIRAGSGNDFIDAKEGNDLIRGGSGQDIMSGGLGADLFLYTFDQIDNSLDIIKDFNQSSGDKLVVETGINVEADSGFIILSYLEFEVKVDIGNDWNSENIIEYANSSITEI